MLERLVLESPVQRTSQRVKWTSEAGDMNTMSLKLCFCEYVQRLSRAKTVKTVVLCSFF